MKLRDQMDALRIHHIVVHRLELENGTLGIDISYFFDDNPKLSYSVREFNRNSKIRRALELIETHLRKDV